MEIQGVRLQQTARVPVRADDAGDEHLVAVRRAVLNDVEHAVGNLLQRMHHAARSASTGPGSHGDRLQASLEDLERLLELLFDYVSPVEMELRPTEAARVAESLAAQLRTHGLGEVSVSAVPPSSVLADPRLLTRCFSLLAQTCARDAGEQHPVDIDVVHDAAGDRVTFALRLGTAEGRVATSHGAMAEAVAARLIELQGGELQHREDGRVRAVVLPAVS
jgi:hypothetical protein